MTLLQALVDLVAAMIEFILAALMLLAALLWLLGMLLVVGLLVVGLAAILAALLL